MNDRTGIGGNNPPSTAELLKEKHKPIFDKARRWLARAKAANLDPKTEADCAKLEELYAEGRDIANDADRIRAQEKEPHLQAGREVDSLFFGEVRDKVGADRAKPGLAQQILQAAADRRLEITRAQQREQAKAAEKAAEEAAKLAAKAQSQEERGRTREADVTAAQADATAQHANALATAAAAPVDQASKTRTAGGRSVAVKTKRFCTGVVRKDLDLEELRPYLDQDALVKAVQKGLDMDGFTELKGAAVVERAVGSVR